MESYRQDLRLYHHRRFFFVTQKIVLACSKQAPAPPRVAMMAMAKRSVSLVASLARRAQRGSGGRALSWSERAGPRKG